jgi:hypothetical protein
VLKWQISDSSSCVQWAAGSLCQQAFERATRTESCNSEAILFRKLLPVQCANFKADRAQIIRQLANSLPPVRKSIILMPKRPREDIPFDDIHACVLNAFQTLGKHGRPADGQRTVLAAWVMYTCDFGPRLVSLATGTKCLTGSMRCEQGRAINDSHAEVLARRCALRWLHAEFRKVLAGLSNGAQ